MRKVVNGALALGLAGALTVAAVGESEARWRAGPAVAAGVIGLAAGAIVGSALASRPYGYYGPGYAYPAYGYGYPAQTYYEPAPVYVAPPPAYGYAATRTYAAPAYAAPSAGQCWIQVDSDKGLGYWGPCR